ncbi:hypothetical protein [Aestuariivirga litoralis]|uniref:hypothetical protein n=1 Tax=Aestuariivirga litoralis TaxID=2650924 RepID=UPI0018C4F973|nr:hypothetical protein [Aestuariivirga litoralis]MBG1230913.1 hypothetical protein [Aestuariivirga litoralis]
MSQTETLMVLGLGAAVTLVLVLLFGRVLWSWAVAASTRRNAKQVPIEMLEMQADRDRLRAEHAIMARKLDLRLDDIKIRMAEQMAEVSRNRNRVQSLLQDIQQKDNALKMKSQENENLQSQLETSRAEIDAAHRTIETLNADARRHDADLSRLQDAFRKLNGKLRDRQQAVGDLNLEIRAALDNVSINDIVSPAAPTVVTPMPEPEAASSRVRQRTAEITSISADMNRSSESLMTGIFMPEPTKVAPLAETVTNRLQEKMDQTASMNDDLQRELREIDQLIGQSVPHDPQPQAKRVGAVANVISLAQRIRALQKGFDE